jgi:hypothetical protein
MREFFPTLAEWTGIYSTLIDDERGAWQMMVTNSIAGSRRLITVAVLTLFATCMVSTLWSQATISTGGIQGTVFDPNGAVVPNAAVSITSKATGSVQKSATTSAGAYSSGALLPGEYEVRVEAKGFRTSVLTLTVQVGVIANGNANLSLGQSSEVVEVTGSSVAINTEQATVQGVLTAQQIENLPINGRNFLDLAQLEPGVQIQDGVNFDPTKNGFSSISFGGRFGRTARIEVDGVDISDETVGTTTQNLPASAIQEFGVSQSSLDMSTELTSSGAVNVVTKSGTNKWHGQGFYLFRDHSIAAKIAPNDVGFQRNNFGGNLGGPIYKNKLFFFADVERLKQDLNEAVLSGGGFPTGGFNSPFRDTQGIGRLDYHFNDNVKLFYRFSYEQNSTLRGFIPNSFQAFSNVDHTPVHAAGLDFNTGKFTHQIRFGWTKFRNGITDATASGNIFNPIPQLSVNAGNDPLCLSGGVDVFCSGPNLLAPQQTFQQNTQIKYDGTRLIGSHILRYGVGFNRIQGGGFAKFFASAPVVNTDPTLNLGSDIKAYPVLTVIMGNGQGFSSEKPAFGLPGGGLGPDNRIQLYFGDSWKIRPNLTLTYGLRYLHDTGRTDSDIASLSCSTLSLGGLVSAGVLTVGQAASVTSQCNSAGNILNMWGAGLGNPIRNPGLNFAPNFGFAWRPANNTTTVVRGGIGLYYENSVFNNNLFNRPGRLAEGLFLGTAVPCGGGAVNPSFAMPDGSPIPVNLNAICGAPMGSVANQLAALQKAYQAATLKAGEAANANYIGAALQASDNVNSIAMFAPNYQTPRSVQMNIGVEHQLGKGIVFSADYIRNVSTHNMLAIDTNHVGDVRFFNLANAQAAISATTNGFGCAGGFSAGAINCAINAGATIADFAGNGLASGNATCGGAPCPAAAFPGQNPLLGVNQMLFPSGRSVLNALDTTLKANVAHPFGGVKAMSWQLSYSLSRYVSTAADSDFINLPVDNNHPVAALGPNGLDRTHQFSFGGTFDLPGYIRFGTLLHVYSPLPLNLRLPGDNGGIFSSDPTGSGAGDGSLTYLNVGGLVPGSSFGAYGRDIKPGDLASFITNYNNTVAGTPTPAGQTLISNGLMTLAQLQAIGAVFQPLAMPTTVQGLGWMRTVDFRLSYPRKFGENFTIEPSVSIFNAFNMSNYDAPGLTLSGILDGGANALNSPTAKADHLNTRVLPGSGVFDLGAPRVIEFGLKLTF